MSNSSRIGIVSEPNRFRGRYTNAPVLKSKSIKIALSKNGKVKAMYTSLEKKTKFESENKSSREDGIVVNEKKR